MDMAKGYRISQCLYVVAKLGIADLLKDGAKHCDVMATATNTNSDSLYRLLRALASIEVFKESKPKCFELTPLGTCLQSDAPGEISSFIIIQAEQNYQAWGHLIHSVRTGENAFEHLHGMNVFDYQQQNVALAELFDGYMVKRTEKTKAAILEAYDFSEFSKLVDVGGGEGTLIAAILQHYPHLTGILFDRPLTIEKAQEKLSTAGVGDRCSLVSGSFFESIPTGGDLYILKNILHNWDNDRALTILKNCHQAMNENGKLVAIELIIPQGNDADNGKFHDLQMLVTFANGRERTEQEYDNLLNLAGFKLSKIISTNSKFKIIESVKI